MSDTDRELVDKDGRVYRQRLFSGRWEAVSGVFGPIYRRGITGRPRIEQGIFGKVEARDWLGRSIRSSDGKRLYRSR